MNKTYFFTKRINRIIIKFHLKNSLSLLFLAVLIACSKDSSDETPSTPSYTLTINQSEGGTVNSSGGSYQRGTEVSISATPNQGYIFTGWSNGSTSNPLNITLNSNIEISPRFEQAIVSRLELSLAQTSVMMGQETNYTYMAYDQNDGPLPDAVPSISISDSLFARIENQRIITEYDGLLTIYGRINEVVDSIQLEIYPDYNNWKTFFRPIENGVSSLFENCSGVGGTCYNTNAVKVDLNNDGREDLLIHYWHFKEVLNLPDLNPVPNRLIALIADEHGRLNESSSSVFGFPFLDLAGGASRHHKIYDINNDGFDDVFFALNREDGRSMDSIETWETQSVAVISNGDGTYRKEVFGDNDFFHSVGIYTNNNGEIEIIMGSDSKQNNTFKYNSTFSEISNVYRDRDGGTIAFYEDDNLMKYGVVSTSEKIGLDFYRNENSVITKFKSFELSPNPDKSVAFTDWLGHVWNFPIIEYDEFNFIGGAFWESNFIKLNPSDQHPYFLVNFVGHMYEGSIENGQEINSSQVSLFNKLFLFDTNQGSNEINILPNSGGNKVNSNFTEVLDLNNDGFQDIVKYPYDLDAKPIVYINNQNNGFSVLPLNYFPGFPSICCGYDTSLFIDVNGDGIQDVLLRQVHGGNSNEFSEPKLFLGRKPLPNQ